MTRAPGAGGNQASCAEGGADIEPGWVCVKRHRIERRPTISPEELKERYYKQGVPVILTDFVTKDWKVFTEDAWAPEKLRERWVPCRWAQRSPPVLASLSM